MVGMLWLLCCIVIVVCRLLSFREFVVCGNDCWIV